MSDYESIWVNKSHRKVFVACMFSDDDDDDDD